MRVCLITPPSPFLLDERVFCSLGILKVGAALRQGGVTVDHVDLTGVANYEDAISDYVGKPDAFAITATTPQYPACLRVRRVLQKSYPNTKVIIGGPHATLVHAAAKRGSERANQALVEILKDFNVVVTGDGEKAIFSAISPFTKGLVDADDPKSILWNTSKDFTDSPWPARDLIDVDSYHYYIDGRRAMTLVGQLGCPMHCNFCGGRNSPMLRQIRKRPADSIIAELKHLNETYGVDGAMFYDDELNINRSIVDVMRGIASMGIDWRLRGFVKAELFTEEQAETMYAAGFRWLLCGFESAHPKILKNIAKNATVEDNTRMLRIAHKHGLKVKALMSFGHPGENEETIFATRDWLLQEKPDDFDCTVITVYPGTPYYDSAVHVDGDTYKFEVNGDVLYSKSVDFSREMQFYKGIPGEYTSYVWTDDLTPQELVRLRDEVENEVRATLGIPFPAAAAAVHFEHSMGANLPPSILRAS